jgi:hypothetical protein
MIEAPWDSSAAAKELAPEQGGVRSSFLPGYYIDFTMLAEDYGWERISSYEEEGFDWRVTVAAMEYWHYQLTGKLTWYDAMSELYSPETMEEHFNWQSITGYEIPRWVLRAKGIVIPPDLRGGPVEIAIP